MAANRICKVLKVNQDNERLMEEVNERNRRYLEHLQGNPA